MSLTHFLVVFATLATASALYFHIGETEKKCFIEEIPDETMVVGNYKVQLYDFNAKDYLPSAPGIGMLVDIRDPEDKTILSRTYASEGRFTFTSHSAGEHVICLHSNSSAWFASGQLRVHLDIQVGEHAVDYQQIQAKDKLSELQLRIRQLLDQVEQITKEQNYQRGATGDTEEKMQAREMLPELKQRIQQLLDEIVHLESQVGVHRDHGRQRNITILLYESIQQYWQMSIRIDVQVGVYKADYKRIWEQVLEMHPMYKLQLRLQELIKQVRQISKLQNYQREREARFRQTSDSTNQRIFWWAIAQIEILVITGFWQMRHLKTFIEAKKLV